MASPPSIKLGKLQESAADVGAFEMQKARCKLTEQAAESPEAEHEPKLAFLTGVTAALTGSACFLAYVSFSRLLT